MKYTLLKNRENLSAKQEASRVEMIPLCPKLDEAYRLKVLFNVLRRMPNKPASYSFLTQWCNAGEVAKIPTFLTFEKTVNAHCSLC
ncbi:MAG: hypothetical protein HOE45_12275 [Gammaproteobacteria bacterium]|nr:hypothetical protein [Gammaproteobacteria bacterium]MBT4147623.1 hypothetical protein [Gammaproteobacteria bacterium]MBT5222587.1 hypothetical protein [Gammaproteobacteria bacterium]MBT5826045.1 hypothetical protein [Gammaproteobacteria bacterium]MBT6419274.1 hypothetical protein [Gammaproteobacteria bacterium]